MVSRSARVALWASLILLGACSLPRPHGPTCAPPVLFDGPVAGLGEDGGADPFDAAVRQAIARWLERGADVLPEAAPADASLDFLALSAGGQWGSFGAGFLTGWSEAVSARPEFEIVTGVSTGAMIAPLAFVGEDHDHKLVEHFGEIDASDVIDTYPAFLLPFRNAVYGTAPLRRTVENITAAIIDEVRTAAANGRLLLVGIVDMDSGAFGYFDLTAIASQGPETNREECFASAILASAAVPVAFPPVFINDRMYVDGGARAQLFVVRLQRAVAKARTVLKKTPSELKYNYYFIVNGTMALAEHSTENGLIPITARGLSIVDDAILQASVRVAFAEAGKDPSAQIRITNAFGSGCEAECGAPRNLEGQFSPCLTMCLFMYGASKGAGPPELKWFTKIEDFETELYRSR